MAAIERAKFTALVEMFLKRRGEGGEPAKVNRWEVSQRKEPNCLPVSQFAPYEPAGTMNVTSS